MTTFVRPPPLDPWEPGVRAVDVPIAEGGSPNPLEDHSINGFETPPLVPNKTDIAKHLYALFTPAFVQPYPDSWIEIAYGDPAVDEGKPNEAKNFSPFKLEQAIAFAVEKNRAGFNIYVGAALRHGEQSYSGRASGHHVLAASHAWTEYEKAGDDERIAAILKDKDLIPAIVLTTGTVPNPRRHLYFQDRWQRYPRRGKGHQQVAEETARHRRRSELRSRPAAGRDGELSHREKEGTGLHHGAGDVAPDSRRAGLFP